MGEVTTGIRGLLSIGYFYDGFQRIVGGPASRLKVLSNYATISSVRSVLDIGCGPGALSDLFSNEVKYVGVDLNKRYIKRAERLYGCETRRFLTGSIEQFPSLPIEKFDLVVAFGLLHHLSDAGARSLSTLCAKHLSRCGKLITIDPCWTNGQSSISRFLVSMDRGKNVRTPKEYVALLEADFAVITHLHKDLIRIPYRHLVMEAEVL